MRGGGGGTMGIGGASLTGVGAPEANAEGGEMGVSRSASSSESEPAVMEGWLCTGWAGGPGCSAESTPWFP